MAEVAAYPQEDILTQELNNPDGCLPEVDQYLTQIPAQSDFDFPLDWLEAAEGGGECAAQRRFPLRTARHRF